MAVATPTISTPIHVRALRAWVLEDYEGIVGLADQAATGFCAGGGRTVGQVAALGYVDAGRRLAGPTQSVLIEGLAWLGERAWFRPHQPQTLEADGVAALGVALGMRSCGRISTGGWLQTLVVRSAKSPEISAVDRSLFIAAAHLIDAPERQDSATMLPEVRLALGHLDLAVPDSASCRDAWQRIMRFAADEEIVPEAVLMLGALNALTERSLPARLGQLDARDVVRVLEGVQRSFKRWSWEIEPRTRASAVARWEVENEYHVQNMLWAVLAPVFPDLNCQIACNRDPSIASNSDPLAA